uniref:vacuolar protein sorting-associated protein 11 homolog n=1 Tax=Styela clava TaxID=7725 RepID=UPI00193A6A0D|nr:vacuolar protein sorting-associated protein 11 homolog [Styela clava]
MAYIQWRRFNFFNKEVIESNATGKTFDMIKDANLQCCTCGRGFLIFGDDTGHIHIVNHNFQVQSFQAYRISVSHLFQVIQHNVLASIGIDEEGVNPVIKIWNMDKRDKSGDPFCSRIQAAIPNNLPSDVSAFSVLSNLSMMAAGFAQGSIVLYKGDVLKDRHGNKTIILETGQGGPVTGLSFRYGEKDSYLFATTHTTVLSYAVSDKYSKMHTLEDQGCPMFCTAISNSVLDNQFLVAASDAVYAYQPDSRGPCFAFDGDKVLARWYHGYLILVYKDKTRAGVSSSALRPTTEKNMLTIYDMNQKIIAYSHALPGVKDVLYEWGSIYVLTADNVLVCLQEIDIHSKLEVLFKKNHYSLAVNMAKNQNLGEEGLMEIFHQYGNHLYSKGDYDGAIHQYVKTIGHLEPSYVIRKFLDAQRIHNLTTYLQAMHEKGEANEDHTTLLLNCFTKLKDSENLNRFIMGPETKHKFDVETAIRVCRQAGYYEHALKLAEKHQKHTWYLKIQLENTKDYKQALAYIRKLPYEEAEINMKKYGKLLMKNVPAEATELLKALCTDYKPSNMPLVNEDDYESFGNVSNKHANVEEFIHIFVNNSERLVAFLQHIIKVEPQSSELVYNTLLELYLHQMTHPNTTSEERRRIEDQTLDLLKEFSSLDYDTDQALVLCQMHCFRPGILFLYESAALYQQILRYHMDHEAMGLVVETCRKHGSKDPSLWQQALTFFARQEDVKCEEHIMQVLTHVDKNNLLPPLLVIQLLSRSSTVSLSVIKDYILRRLQKETEEIDQHEKVIQQCQEDTKKMKEQIEELKTTATIFQVTKCSLCNHDLELPSVHFLCKHSFHQHCFESYSENDQECPVCAGENRKILEHMREQEQALLNNRNLYDQFSSQVRQSRDGFSIIADYFARGVFNKVTLVTESKVRGNSATANPFEASSGSNPFEDSGSLIDVSLQRELKMMQQANR